MVLDDLSTGLAKRVPDGVPLIRATWGMPQRCKPHCASDVTGVVHLAAAKKAVESVERPEYYYRENVDGMLTLLEAMAAVGTRCFVYSSSAAVYGTPARSSSARMPCWCRNPRTGRPGVVGESG